MKDVLNIPRTVMIAGTPTVFENFGDLDKRIAGFVTLIQNLEAALPSSDMNGWAGLVAAADILVAHLDAADAWLQDHDLMLKREEDSLRQAIHDLNLSNG